MAINKCTKKNYFSLQYSLFYYSVKFLKKNAEHTETSSSNDDVHSVQTSLISDVNMNILSLVIMFT